jgi:hypothetical protein
MTFEFYKNRINQDMLDDLKINRIIIERTKQQAKRYDEIKAEEAGLTDFQLDDFNKIYLSFSSTLDDYVNKLEANTEIFRNAGLVIYRYNLLATVLNKVKFNFLPKIEKDKLVNQLEDLEPKIEELYRYANINDFTDLKTIGEILNNFKKKTFQQVKVGDVRLKEIQPIGETSADNLDTIINYLSTLSNTEKELLTKTDISNLEKLSQKAQQIKRDIQKGKSKEIDIEQPIKDFEKLYLKISKKLQQQPQQRPAPPQRPLPQRPVLAVATTPEQTQRPAREMTDPLGVGTAEEEEPQYEGEPAGADPFYFIKITPKAEVNGDLKSENAKGKVQGLNATDFYNKYKIIKKVALQFLTDNPYYDRPFYEA